ncbi:MBL fold metallo-hydrolase [Fredinandcohnia humi]
MLLKKLTWAGVLIKSGETVVLVDPLGNTPGNQDKPFAAKLGNAQETFIDLKGIQKPNVILITHIHPDHFDPISIKEAFGEDIPVLIPTASIEIGKKFGLKNVIGVSIGDTKTFGDFRVSPTYSADGYGSPQVSWVIEGAGKRIIHSGDTLWHGNWWRIRGEFGKFDVACLPINGAVLDVAGLSEQTNHHACMIPEEAVEAAKILGANHLVPIHFKTFHNEPFYIETPNAVPRLLQKAKEREVNVTLLQPDQNLELL